MNKENLIEIVFIALLFTFLLYIGPGEVFQHKLSHDKPVQYGATDGFLYAMLTNHVKETGNFRFNPFYSTAGFNDSIAYHPPMLMHIAAGFSYASGLNAYDSLSFIMGFFVLFAAFIMYWLIRSFNKKVAMLSAPVFVFLYVMKFLIGYVWGEALLLMGSFFLVALFFIMSQQLKYWWIPAGILIAATINTHTSETIWFYGFAVFFLGIKLITKQLQKHELKFWLKQLGFATILAVILSLNFLIIFYNGYYKITGESYSSFRAISPEEFGAIQVPPLYDFHWLVLLPILAGVILALFYLKKNANPALIASGFMFLIGMTNYVGLHYRAFQARFLWPIYLAVFFGLTAYTILRQIWKGSILVPAIIGIVLAGIFANAYYSHVHPDVIRDTQWQAFKWVEQNTPERSKTLFLYGDGYSQSIRLVKRMVHQVDGNDYARFLTSLPNQTLKIEPVMMEEMKYIHRNGLFNFGYYSYELNMTPGFVPMDICGFDYYVVDKASAYSPQFAQANVQLGNVLMNHNMTLAYQNDQVAIIKNTNLGGDCLG
jgi:hypothetical protein